jgi:anti-sigma28 factor (negative regulator of flagellin synthesis)
VKINDPNGRAVTLGRSQGVTPIGDPKPRSGAGASKPSTDRVQLSNLGAQMAAAYNDSPAHVAKLSSLTATVSSGSYQVDAGVLSNSIIEANLQFGGGTI